jgi:phospholipid/cholesterol/gamma-HCH transport system substrate-binding protein
MKDETRNVMVGLTAMAGLAGLALLLVLFGYVPQLLDKGYDIRVELEHAAGLSAGSRVRLSGIDIGKLSSIELQPQPKAGVVAVMHIRPEFKIPEDASITVIEPILTGSPSISIAVSHLNDRQLIMLLPTDGSATVQGEVPEFMRQLAGELSIAMEKAVVTIKQELQQPLATFGRIEQDIHDLSQRWADVGRNVNALIEERSPAQVDAGEVKANLTTVIQRTDQRLTELKQMLAASRRWIDQIEAATQKTGAAAEKIGSSADAARRGIEQLTKRYVALADDLSKAIADVQKLADMAATGKGTAAKLLTDPKLYESLNDSAERIGLAADEIKLLIQKWKAEGVPIDF